MSKSGFGPAPLLAFFRDADGFEPRRSVPWAPAGRELAERRRLAHDDALVGDPALVRDPTLNIKVDPTAPTIRSIGVLGDSISHGVQGAVVARPQHAWPTLLGQRLGIEVRIAKSRRFAPKFLETVLLVAYDHGKTLLDDAARAWTELRRDPVDRPPDVLAVTGFDLDDAVKGPARASGYTRDVLGGFTSPLAALRDRCRDDTPDLLVVMLGANCVLRSVVTLDARWADAPGAGTVWTPQRFEQRFVELVEAVLDLGIPNIVLSTVPHVSVAPITRGQNLPTADEPSGKDIPSPDETGEQPYFLSYRWIFDRGWPSLRELSGETVEKIDQTIDVYNRVIRRSVVNARNEGRNVLLFDLCGLLDHVALKRNAAPSGEDRRREFPVELFAGLERQGNAEERDEARRYLDSRFTLTGTGPEGSADEGGLVSIDGVHPSAAGQLVIARGLARVLKEGGMAVPEDRTDVAGLLMGDPLLRSFADSDAAPLPTRRWLELAEQVEGVVDGLADAVARRIEASDQPNTEGYD